MSAILELAQLGIWGLLWAMGGIWLAGSAFNLTKDEQLITGLALGLVLENWLANLLARALPVSLSFWTAAGLVFAGGLFFSILINHSNLERLIKIRLFWGQIFALCSLALLLTLVGRGMAILEDYQNLPTISLMAAGDIPPHFALDPERVFNYHYDTLLLATQLDTLAGLYPWMGLDLARGLCAALTLLLGYLYTRRLTRSHLAGILAVLVGLFAGGARWLILLLPEPFLANLSANIFMLGTGSTSAPTFQAALMGTWQVDTGSPFPMPFALANGINPPWIWTFHAGGGAIAAVASAALLLTHNRWQGWLGGVISTILVAAIALGSELSMVTIVGSLLLVAIIQKASHRSSNLPSSLRNWLVVAVAASIIAAFQGGVLTGAVTDIFAKVLPGTPGGNSYFTGGFQFLWPPALLSTHLGYLAFNNPYQLSAALFEIGPLIFTLPLVLIWGWKTYRFQRWYESALFLGALLSFFFVFVKYTGSAGPTAITRIQSSLFILPRTWAVPVLWIWAHKRSQTIKTTIAALFVISMIGGISLLGYELIGIARPQFGTFINVMDVRMMNQYWNKLELGTLIFDPVVFRAPTVFGRATNSHQTWYTAKTDWVRLSDNPEPRSLREFGFSYAYFDVKYWDEMSLDLQDLWDGAGCQQLLAQEESKNPYDFRRLYDIRNCE